MEAAVSDFDEALAVHPGDEPAAGARKTAEATLIPWRFKLADQLFELGLQAKAVSVEDAIGHWQKAAAEYGKILEKEPAHAGAKSGREKINTAMHDAHVELGATKELLAEAPSLSAGERDALLEQALEHFQTAATLAPQNPQTREHVERVGRKLTGLFVSRGQAELAEAKQRAATRLPEAIAAAERAGQSFGQALRFAPDHAGAKAGRAEAEALLKRLRELDAREQRRILGEGKDLKDPKDLENPDKLALKLLDFDNDKLASKKQQNLSAPENRPLKHW